MAAGDGPRFLLCCRGRLRTGRAGQMGPATLRGDGGAAAAACVVAREVPGECRVKLRVLFFRRSSPSRSLQPVSKSPRHRLTTCTHPDRAAGSAVQGRQRRGACPHRRAGAASGVRCRGFLDGARPSLVRLLSSGGVEKFLNGLGRLIRLRKFAAKHRSPMASA